MKNKLGQMKGGWLILVVIALVAAYMFNLGGIQDLFKVPEDKIAVDNCPSSGLTEWTLNAQEALASTATDANVSYYVYDNGVLVKSGDTGTDGTVSIDVECGRGKTYQALVLNENTTVGFYPQQVTIDASGPTDVSNLKMYEYGQVSVANVGSSSDPTGDDNISAGTGKNCGFTITFSNNESASGINKPLIMCLVNVSAVTDVTMSGVTEASAKKPNRISAISNHQYYVFELDKLVKSTDSAIKVNGMIQFSSSASIVTTEGNNMSCIVVDQATYRKAEYKTLSLSEGFVEAAENVETISDIGAPDSNRMTLEFAGTYC